MPLRTSQEYRASLRDGRRVLYRGVPVDDVTTHASLARTVDHAAGVFELAAEGDPALWRFEDPELGEISTFFMRPLDAAGLQLRGDAIEASTRYGRSTFNIIKAVGSDALLGLEAVASAVDAAHDTGYAARVSAFRAACATSDAAVALAATDAKGDRSLPPHAQPDPDSYLRVVRRDEDGIVVRGAKLHTTASVSANELICIPCRALGPDDADYAVAFAVPLNAPGLTLVCHPLVDGPDAEAPVSSRNIEVETLTLFDDVHVPWERVFLCGEWQHAGAVARAFANYHRFTAISYKPPFIDLMIGATALAADQLGILKSGAVREKLGRLIVYGDLVRCARLAAGVRSGTGPTGLAEPDPVAANAGKYHFASGFHQAVATLQDVCGGLVVTAPGIEDLDHPELGPFVERMLAGRAGVSGRERWALAQLVRDLTASEWGGWNQVATLHGEGSLGAQLIESVRAGDVDGCVTFAREVLALD